MPNIVVQVNGRTAIAPLGAAIISNNAGYTITFEFDEEWDTSVPKTARFICGGWVSESAIVNGTASVPMIPAAFSKVLVGVCAGELSTTTPAVIRIAPSVVAVDLSPETAAEIDRVRAEAERVANEIRRIANEEQRIANEEARQNDPSKKVYYFDYNTAVYADVAAAIEADMYAVMEKDGEYWPIYTRQDDTLIFACANAVTHRLQLDTANVWTELTTTDDEPTEGSNKLLSSDAIYRAFCDSDKIFLVEYEETPFDDCVAAFEAGKLLILHYTTTNGDMLIDKYALCNNIITHSGAAILTQPPFIYVNSADIIMQTSLQWQKTTVFDEAPTANHHDKWVTSHGIYNALQRKVDKVAGKGLSTNDYTAEEKAKVDRMYGKKDNLFDKADPDIVIGRYISGITSDQPKWTSNSSRGETGYIPVNAGERIAYLPTRESVATATYYALFDADKQVVRVSSTYSSNKYVSIPEGAAYIRFSMLLANIDTIMIIKLDDSDPLPVDPANYTYNVYGGYSLYETVPRVDAIESAIMPLVPRITRALGKDNLFDKTDEDIVNGRYISSVSGGEPSWTSNAAYAETGYIPVSPGDRLAIMPTADTVSTALYYARFNSQKQIVNVSSTYASDKYVSIPKDGSVSFIRFAYSVRNTDTLMVIRLDDSDPLPVDATNYTYSVFGGYTLPQLAADTQAALDTAVEQLQAQIGAAVSVGAQWYGKTCYCYGTSITSVHEGTGKYPPYLASLSGMNVVEKGRGGGGIGNAAGNWSSYSRGQVYASVCNITDGKTTADLIVLETGANDVADDVPLGTIFDTGTETLAGCLTDCIRYLQTNTNAQIAVMPSPSSKTSPQVKPKYYEWADMIRQICDVNRIHFLSPNTNLGQAKLVSSMGSLYVVDNIHQTELGGYILAEQMWYQIRNIPCFYTELPANSNE